MAYTKRQRAFAVGECYKEGLSRREIAQELGCSERVVTDSLRDLASYDRELYLLVRSQNKKIK